MVLVIRSSTSNSRYGQVKIPNTAVRWVISTAGEVRNPAATTVAGRPRSRWRPTMPSGTNSTTFNAVCWNAGFASTPRPPLPTPSVWKSAMNRNGRSCAVSAALAEHHCAVVLGVGRSV